MFKYINRNGEKMAHKKKLRGKKLEEKPADIGQIISQIEKEIKMPTSKEIENYEIAAIVNKIKKATERISEKEHRKALEDANALAKLLDKGDPKYLSRWG